MWISDALADDSRELEKNFLYTVDRLTDEMGIPISLTGPWAFHANKNHGATVKDFGL